MSSKHSRYINPLLDFSFKKIFGSDPNKDLLIDFLNEIFKGRKLIIDLVYNRNDESTNHTAFLNCNDYVSIIKKYDIENSNTGSF